jgi:methyltransferase (TIGR00027 family)
LERATHPGITRHYWLRKRWIEARVQAALAGGTRRVVVLGAGLDTLALRLANAWPGVAWVEVDHPATQSAKRRALSRAGVAMPPTLRFVAADLARDAGGWPREVGAEPGTAAIVVLEGLLMYLDRGDVVRLLVDQLPEIAGGPLTVVFSYMVEWPDGRGGFRPASLLVDAWLAAQREPFRWFQRPETLPGWMSDLGYSVVAHASPPFDAGVAAAPLDMPPLQGENLVEAVLKASGG